MTIKEMDEKIEAMIMKCLKREMEAEENEAFMNAVYWDGFIKGLRYFRSELNNVKSGLEEIICELEDMIQL